MKVIIVGGLHHNTLGVIRALGERRITPKNIMLIVVDKITPKRNILSASRFICDKNIFYINGYDSLTNVLLQSCKTNGENPVIICCSDGAAMHVLFNRSNLAPFFHIPSLEMNVKDMFDKDKQTKIAQIFGLDVPKSAVLSSGNIGVWNTYPCITKPIMSVNGGGKADIYISYNKEELQQHLAGTEAESVQVQEYLLKKIEYQLIGCSLNAGETVVIPGYTNILRQPKNTNTGYLRYSQIRELNIDVDKVKKYIKYIGYSGLFSLEFLRAEDGKDYYMEINMRNDGNAYCVTSAGVNLPYIWVYYNRYGKMPKDEPQTFEKSILWIPDLSDMSLGIREVGFWKWLKEFIQADSHSVYNSKDIIPFFIDILFFVRRMLRKIGRKKRIC